MALYPWYKSMIGPWLKTCLPNIWRDVSQIFKYIFTQCLKICFPNIWRHHYPMIDDMFIQCLHMFIKSLKTCLPDICFVWRITLPIPPNLFGSAILSLDILQLASVRHFGNNHLWLLWTKSKCTCKFCAKTTYHFRV